MSKYENLKSEIQAIGLEDLATAFESMFHRTHEHREEGQLLYNRLAQEFPVLRALAQAITEHGVEHFPDMTDDERKAFQSGMHLTLFSIIELLVLDELPSTE